MLTIENKTDTDIEMALEQYDAISPPYHFRQLSKKGVWIINDQYIVKHIRKTHTANNICIILDSIKDTYTHIGKYVCTKNGQAFFHGMNDDFIVTEFIKGQPFNINQVLNEKDVLGKTIGYSLAKLHYSFTKIMKGNFNIANTMSEYDEAIRFLYKNNIIVPDYIKNECEIFKEIYKCLPRQIVHRDIHLGNIIIDDHYNVFFLDFDSSENNVRIFDIAYFGMSLLDAIDNKTKLRQWWSLYGYFLQGYFNGNPLNQKELSSIWNMFIVLQICFIKYFFKIDNNIKNANSRLDKLIYIYNHRNNIIKSIE